MPQNEKFKQLEVEIAIDRDNLENELINQANWHWHASKEAIDAISFRDNAKADVDNYEANLSLTFRYEAINRNERRTEAQIESLVKSDANRIELVQKYLMAKRNAERWLALRDSFVQKGYALKELVSYLRHDQVAEASYSEQRREAFRDFKKPG
jgi:hypothetical protein